MQRVLQWLLQNHLKRPGPYTDLKDLPAHTPLDLPAYPSLSLFGSRCVTFMLCRFFSGGSQRLHMFRIFGASGPSQGFRIVQVRTYL